MLRSRVLNLCIQRACSKNKTPAPNKGNIPVSSSNTGVLNAVTGLSSNCVRKPDAPLGPGATLDGEYKVPEYFCFNQYTFTEAEIELAKYRLPQPSALKD